MTKYQLEYFRDKIKRNLNPLIENLNKQLTKYLGVSWHEQPRAIEHK
jgi:hypothetical protein